MVYGIKCPLGQILPQPLKTLKKYDTNTKIIEMDNFFTIRFRRATAQRFKSFSKKVSGSHSESIEQIIDFFEWHGFLLAEKFKKGIGREILRNRKRTDVVVAIIRDIEKHRTKPTTAMLELLFERSPKKENARTIKPYVKQKRDPQQEAFIKKVEAAIAMECENTNLKIELKQNRKDIKGLLDSIHLINSVFGKSRLELDMDPKDFERLKQRIQKG
ncbi:hypothetical protein DHC50_20285 [Arenibacter sp. A80]|nr:hypothetical protein [Arenibacter sp. A80]RFT54392.1 hypothetical protein D0S24_20280 [Arenibacter sp. P308M17]